MKEKSLEKLIHGNSLKFGLIFVKGHWAPDQILSRFSKGRRHNDDEKEIISMQWFQICLASQEIDLFT